MSVSLTYVGYALSSAGYAVLLLLLFTVRKPGLAKHLLVLATLSTCVWSVSHILFPFEAENTRQLFLFDNIKNLCWVLFICGCIQVNFSSLADVLKRPITWAALSLPLMAMLIPWLVKVPLNVRLMGQTIIALEILVLLEIIYRQTSQDRWAFKPLILFLGATSLFEFVTFANATMVNAVEHSYIEARGFIYLAFLPFLVLAIRRIQHWGINIFVSRDVVLHSSLLMVAGAYLLLMAMAGYVVRYFGGEWGSSVQIILVFLSLALLLTLFLSNQFRTRIKVFITKHFFANQFDYRIEWVKLTESLAKRDTDLSSVYQTALTSMLQVVNYQFGYLVKVKNDRVVKLASVNSPKLTDIEQLLIGQIAAFCKEKKWIVDLDELRVKPFVYEGIQVNYEHLSRCGFQLVLPIYKLDKLWGLALLGAEKSNKRHVNWEVRDYLNAVTAQVTSYLLHHEAAKEVAENAQFAAFNRMSAFVLHDLKNVLAQIDLILANAEQHKHNPEFIDDTFETLQHTKARMEKMLRQLTDKNAPEIKGEGVVKVSELIDLVLKNKCAALLPVPVLDVISEQPAVLDSEKLSNVIYHLVSNAQQATADQGYVKVSLEVSLDEQYQVVKIADNGCGMSQSFIQQRLFKAFDTTKGNAGMGIGAYDAKHYLEKIGGQIDVESEVGQGTTFTLMIPLH